MPKGNTILFFLFLYPLCCLAQNKERVPLSVVLKQIEKSGKIVFNRLDQDIDFYTIIPPPGNLTLKQKLSYIEARTRLRFTPADKTHYIIQSDVSTEHPICGYLIDNQTGQPIEGAQIFTSAHAPPLISDNKGYFTLPVSAPAAIQVFHVLYDSLTITPIELYVPQCPQFKLKEVITHLQEVVAERYIARGISKKETGELVVKPRAFSILPGLTEPDVLQTMQQLPGIASVDETVSNINVRGGTHDQNLFLWNGIRMYQTSHFFGLLSAFNPLQANSISIYKNGTPAFYGEGVSSLVNISTKLQSQDNGYAVAAADMINANVLGVIKLSPQDVLQVSARRTLPFNTPAFNNYRDRIYQNTVVTDTSENPDTHITTRDDFCFYDASFSYQHGFNTKHRFILSGIGIQNNLDVYQQAGTAQRNSSLNQSNFGGSAAITSVWSERSSTQFEGYVSSYLLDGTYEAVENEQTTIQANKVNDAGFGLRYNYNYNQNINFSAGYQFNGIAITNTDRVNLPEYSSREKTISLAHAVILEGNYTSENTNITLGIRGNYFEKYNTFLAQPRLTFSQKLNNRIRLEIAAEQKSQVTSQVTDLEQDFLGIERRRWMLANGTTIPIQKSLQSSTGLNYSHNGWYASLEGFYKKVSGISSKSQSFRNQFEFQYSTGSYRVLGCEALIQKKIGSFHSWLSYSYNDNQYDFNGYIPPVFLNNFAVSHAVSSAGIYEHNNFRLALGAKWRTGTPVTGPLSFTIDPDDPTSSEIIYKAPNSDKLTDNLSVNFSASKSWNLSENTIFTASVSVTNLLNRRNVISRYYRVNINTNTVESVNTYGMARTPNLSLKIVFL
jgi:TonB-dependent Receptor Plug Domain/TonB dependent receptor